MSASYAKYSAMSEAQLQKAIADRRVTPEYLGWLGVIGPGKTLREIIK